MYPIGRSIMSKINMFPVTPKLLESIKLKVTNPQCDVKPPPQGTRLIDQSSQPMLILIRHAKPTVHRKRNSRNIRIALTEVPKIQELAIKLVKQWNLSGEAIPNRIISSTFVRAYMTAQYLVEEMKKHVVDLPEIEYDENIREFEQYDESFEEFNQRLQLFIRNLSEYQNQVVLVVCHGLVIKHIEELLLGKSRFERGRDVPHIVPIIINEVFSKCIAFHRCCDT